MYPSGRKKCIWIANSDTIPALLELSISVGTGGDHVKVMSESDGNFTLLTRPIYFCEHSPTLGDLGDIILIDPSQYLIGMRQELIIQCRLVKKLAKMQDFAISNKVFVI